MRNLHFASAFGLLLLLSSCPNHRDSRVEALTALADSIQIHQRLLEAPSDARTTEAATWAETNLREFELLLSDLRVGDGGALMLAHYLVARDLARANELLEAARVQAPLCPYGQPTARSRALNRVVTQFFVGQVQPWLVRLRQRKEALHQPIKALEAPLGAVLPPDYIDWAMQRDQLLINQTQVIKTHVQTIQRTLAACGES